MTKQALALVASATMACSTAACSSSMSSASSSGHVRGDRLSQPEVLSTADRTDQFRSSQGGRTTLGKLQRGRLMLLYFGYTHCPDVCPTTMADLGQALRQLPAILQARTQVVFVTADPARDSPPVMKSWLTNFDPGVTLPFVGLTASVQQIDAVAKSLGIPLSPPVREKNGSYSVEHGAQTLAFLKGKAQVLWLAGTTIADYAHDIRLLVPNRAP